jgi:hypothetical protein
MAGINDYSNTAGSNTTINGIDIAEGCSPAGINNAIRQLMADIADIDDGVVPLQTPDINGGTIDGAVIGGTTPAAGTFTTITTTGDINFGDNDKAQFGASNELQIYKATGGNSYIQETGTSNLRICGTEVFLRDGADTENLAVFRTNGASELYYDNSQKLATTSTGVTVTGTVTADGLSLGDGEKAYFGASNDLEIYHDGSNSVIKDTGTGNLYLAGSSQINITNSATNQSMARFIEGGAVELFHNNSKKLETTSTGIDVTGNASADIINIYNASEQGRLNVSNNGAEQLEVFPGDVSNKVTLQAFNRSTVASSSFRYIASTHEFTAGGSERMRIDSSGRVGIGTSSPANSIEVNYATVGTGNGSNNALALVYNSSSMYAQHFMDSNGIYNIYADQQGVAGGNLTLHADNNIRFSTGSWTSAIGDVVIDSSGNVGIGTNSPSSFNSQARNLVVGTGSGANGITIYSGNTSTADILFADGTSGNDPVRGGINYNHSNNSMNFRVNDSPKMYILSSGNVGIGTNSPTEKLEVTGNLILDAIDSNIKIKSGVGGTTGAVNWTLNTDSTSYASISLPYDTRATTGLLIQTTAGYPITLNAGNGVIFKEDSSEKMRIDSSGNVGIGTSSPSTALDVNGTVKATAFQGDGSALTGISGGGKIGQVVTSNLTTHNSITTSGWTDTGITATITPSSASSKILILWKVFFSNASGDGFSGKLVRASTDIGTGTGTGTQGTMTFATANANSYWSFDNSGNYLDSPSTTSATTYKIQVKPQAGTLTMYINRSARANSTDPTGISTITLMEVLA